MKRTIVLIVAIFLVGQNMSGQEDMRLRKNHISFEILTFYGVGIAYERLFNTGHFVRGSIRGGLISSFSPSIGGSMLLGKQHNLELGVDYLIRYEEAIAADDEQLRFSRLEPFFGYRFQSKKGFTIRAFCPFRFDSYFGIPNIGLSFGYTF